MSLAHDPLPSDPEALRAFAAGLQAELARKDMEHQAFLPMVGQFWKHRRSPETSKPTVSQVSPPQKIAYERRYDGVRKQAQEAGSQHRKFDECCIRMRHSVPSATML